LLTKFHSVALLFFIKLDKFLGCLRYFFFTEYDLERNFLTLIL